MEAMLRRGFLLGKEKKVDDAKRVERWRKTDMVLLRKLSTALCLKKMDELAEADRNKGMMTNLANTGSLSDPDAEQVIEFCRSWNSQWAGKYGSFDDITIIDSMRFTYDPPPPCARPCNTIQLFSVKVASIK